MTIHFTTHQIKGKGRGKFIGFPTINMAIPGDFELEYGIYAAWVTLEGVVRRGAMHWGPIPTFEENDVPSLEVFLIGLEGQDLSNTNTTQILVEIVKKIRNIEKFASVTDLTDRMAIDVSEIRAVLKE